MNRRRWCEYYYLFLFLFRILIESKRKRWPIIQKIMWIIYIFCVLHLSLIENDMAQWFWKHSLFLFNLRYQFFALFCETVSAPIIREDFLTIMLKAMTTLGKFNLKKKDIHLSFQPICLCCTRMHWVKVVLEWLYICFVEFTYGKQKPHSLKSVN